MSIFCLGFFDLAEANEVENDVVEACFKTASGEKIELNDVVIQPEVLVTSSDNLACFSEAASTEYSREVEASIRASNSSDSGFATDDRNVGKVWLKVYYSRMGDKVLITRVQGNVGCKNGYRLGGYFVKVACTQDMSDSQSIDWKKLPIAPFDRYTDFKQFVDVSKHDYFDCSARSEVQIYKSNSGKYFGTAWLALKPFGGV